jgi:uncharacterized protein with von Willebrand factor type A (vWA) domain
MVCDLNCSMDSFYEMCEVEDWCRAFKGVKGREIYIYIIYIYIDMKLVEVKEADFWRGDEVFTIIRKCGVDFWNWIVIN